MSDAVTASGAYLTVTQAAQALNCSPDTVRRMIARGELRALRFDRLIRIAVSDLRHAGKPITSFVYDSNQSSPTAQLAQSGRLPGEDWAQWSKRRSGAS